LDLFVRDTNPGSLISLMQAQTHADYVYMYPPRQSYRAFSPAESRTLRSLVKSSLERSHDLNLYVHVPFCRQICSFCNLYSTNDLRRDTDEYLEAVLKEAGNLAEISGLKRISTLYIGGGTPSILSPTQIERLIRRLLMLFSQTPERAPTETALEVDPATVDASKLRQLRATGVNRINLGYQSMVNREVMQMGRRRSETAGLGLLESALASGFDNVCVDLIYGLREQTDEGWLDSLQQVVALGPPTVCAYALTLRPFTGYHRRGYRQIDGEVLYRRYETADQFLLSAGYRRETHVRWVRPTGGYLQKSNHWKLENVLGLGAGARSYLWGLDSRNGYSVRSRSTTLDAYMRKLAHGEQPLTDGFVMSAEERMRKAVALNIASLSRPWFISLFGSDPVDVFPAEYGLLRSLGVCNFTTDRICLSEGYYKYRDLLAQIFFSETVRRHVAAFDYNE
jgi:oxygen-independent coproporphyrinogen III oxidase